MTDQRDRIALRSGLEDLLGPDRAATLWSMLQYRDDLATQADVLSAADGLRAEMGSLRDDMRGDMSALRGEVKEEIALVRGEVAEIRSELNSFIRTFITVQAATIAAATGIVYALVRFT